MTDIPGTTTITPKKKDDVKTLSLVNIKELKTKKSDYPKPEDLIWYNQLKYWLLFGAIISIIFIILSLIDIRFLAMTPAGPIAAFLSWNVRRYLWKIDKKTEKLFKRR